MADHLTEEEQIQALKSWWKDNWLSIVVPVVAVVVGYAGWSQYKNYQQSRAEAGYAQYEELVKHLDVNPGTELSEVQVNAAREKASGISAEFAGSLYANQADLILARLSVEDGDLEGAAKTLAKVAAEGANESIVALANARLARVRIQMNEYDAALMLVIKAPQGGFESLYAEIRGDALAAQGRAESAQTAYQEAIDNLDPQQFSRRSILQLKKDGVGVIGASAGIESENEESSEKSESGAEDPQSNADAASVAVESAQAESAAVETP